ncbi:CATRA system-associated protein [Polymorphospora sp. NPDC051019]|uniref:CATRA system-associated protein n=1 Tax=Polymorphospora sp. NPDC051019 TaxID=3155725 RepID=UPI0034347D44
MQNQLPPRPAAGPEASEPDAVRDARDILADLIEWHLPDQRWSTVEELLTDTEAAIAARDLTALAHAVAALELAGPDRIQRVSAPPDRSVPQTVRERVGRTVDAMTAAYPPAGPAPAKPSRR